MTTLTEKRGAGFFLASEANGTRSREQITIASGAGDLATGTILGKITTSGLYVPLDPDADPEDGSEIAAGVLFDAVDATSAAKTAVAIVRDAEVSLSGLVYPAGGDVDDINAELAAIGLIVR